ncbi:hypothetical protein C3709_11955 [Lelliottia aquatilis]|uniref:Spore coat protein U domain-containing protein n=1 Tax=Lelliottia aquatilis TaxID=2080838 RepID=A0ABX4ZXE2_9ENTR|nr:hypothetical protein C3708_20100 [Lelliottia sp. 7254-16]POZ20541.1 hypothetical protein C3712_18165 [Lelliottia aquatilis]POZ22048.1 hypothetical protein C3711_18910 [Lelliottia aquatilis]POZ33106.1 hypothetical protein C3710_10180 [Lelliottia aquatilis]POZ38246.1 hypothetical protein C3709_11955 [Lelliottia aquatilis]
MDLLNLPKIFCLLGLIGPSLGLCMTGPAETVTIPIIVTSPAACSIVNGLATEVNFPYSEPGGGPKLLGTVTVTCDMPAYGYVLGVSPSGEGTFSTSASINERPGASVAVDSADGTKGNWSVDGVKTGTLAVDQSDSSGKFNVRLDTGTKYYSSYSFYVLAGSYYR